jgi:hypothetical protein
MRIKSHSESTESNDRSLLPSIYEVVLSYAVAVVILAVLALPAVIKKSNNENFTLASTELNNKGVELLSLLHETVGSSALTIMLWSLFGLMTYITLWAAGYVVSSYKNEASVLNSTILPRGSKRINIMHLIIVRIMVRTLAAVLLLLWAAIFFIFLLDAVINLILTHVNPFSWLLFRDIFIGLTTIAASIMITTLLLRLSLLRRKIFYT